MRNFGNGIAQELHVVFGYVGDDTMDWSDDIGAVQSASHAYFNDCVINSLRIEVFHGHGKGEFEEGGFEITFVPIFVSEYEISDKIFLDPFTIDFDALSEI